MRRNATDSKWSVVISGVDRSEASTAFRDSVFKDSWFANASVMHDDEPDSGLIVTIDVANLTDLMRCLKCCRDLHPAFGIQLCVYANFGSVKANFSLCTKDGAFLESSCVLS